MKNLRQEFLDESISGLENLHQKLSVEILSESLLRETFRFFHTLKGTSQTFNFNMPGRIAHELENLLQAAKDGQLPPDKNFIRLLREGTEILSETFRRDRDERENNFPNEFVQKLRNLIPDYSVAASEDFFDTIPLEVLRQLTIEEKNSLAAAMLDAGKFYAVEVEFELSDFADKFRRLRDNLSAQSRIIATFPHSALSRKDKIGFRVFFVSRQNRQEIIELTKPFAENLTLADFKPDFAGDSTGVLAQAVAAGEKVARRFNKKIEFETTAEKIEISGKRLKLISAIFLHLIRNAVDHAIEKNGKIKIELLSKNDNLLLRVTDDGRGLDAKKIKHQAVRKKMIAADADLTRQEIFNLIFNHGFSTAETVSEISGRGIGLDVVKDLTEKAGGEIRVESETGKGTIFEISLPKNETKAKK